MAYRNIILREYDCPVNKRNISVNLIHESNSKISTVKLSIAIARTILTDPYKYKFLVYQVGSSLLFLKYILSKDKSFSLIDGARKSFRDFSSNSRIGEMAQGIAFLFVTDVLRFPFFIDFKNYLESQHLPVPPSNKSTPDFVMYDFTGKDIILVEVKGRWPKSLIPSELKAKFTSALRQCNNGNKYLSTLTKSSPVKGKYAIVVDMFEKSNPNKTTLNMSDPPSTPDGSVENPKALIKRHYVNWFLIIGDLETAIRLNKGLNIGEIKAKVVEVEAEPFYILNHSKSEIDKFLSSEYGGNYIYGISVKVWDFLNDEESKLKEDKINFKPIEKDGIHLFSDGTLVMEKDIPM